MAQQNRRVPVPREVDRRLRNFYGGKVCVVSGNDGEWHHLDEVLSDHRFCNLIPLDATNNKAIDNTRRGESPKFDLDGALADESLSARSREWFFRGQYAKGYACSRLAAFLSSPRKGARLHRALPSRRLYHGAWALAALRQTATSDVPELIGDTVWRTLLPAFDQRPCPLEPEQVALVACEVGSVLRDYDCTEGAITWGKLALEVARLVPPGQGKFSLLRFKQQYAMSLARAAGERRRAALLFDTVLDDAMWLDARSETTARFWRLPTLPEAERRSALDGVLALGGDVPMVDASHAPPGITYGTLAEAHLADSDYLLDKYPRDKGWRDALERARTFFFGIRGAPSGGVRHPSLQAYYAENGSVGRLPRRCCADLDGVRDPIRQLRMAVLAWLHGGSRR